MHWCPFNYEIVWEGRSFVLLLHLFIEWSWKLWTWKLSPPLEIEIFFQMCDRNLFIHYRVRLEYEAWLRMHNSSSMMAWMFMIVDSWKQLFFVSSSSSERHILNWRFMWTTTQIFFINLFCLAKVNIVKRFVTLFCGNMSNS